MSMSSTEKLSSRPDDPNADQVFDPYPGSKVGRHTKLAVTWHSVGLNPSGAPFTPKAIARDLLPHLVSLTYVDNLSGAADDLQLELEDRDELWTGGWSPTFGDTVVARLDYDGWFGTSPVTSLKLGTFAHDKFSLAGPPHRVTLACISAALSTGLRRAKHTHAWRGVTLKQIASDIAQKAGLDLDFSGDAGTTYKSANQNDKSNLEFLQELCSQVGRTVKVTEKTIVIYDEKTLDAEVARGEIDLRAGRVLSWSFDVEDAFRYGSCHVTCFDPRTGKTIKGDFPANGQTVKGLDPNGQTLELVIQVSDGAAASKFAEKALRRANRRGVIGKIVTVGDPGLVAGVTFNLKNAGKNLDDGRYIVARAEHRVGTDGYTTSLDLRRCLEGY